MGRVTHFDISALDTNRFIDFYKSIFDWKFEKWGNGEMNYWLITTGSENEDGINGGLSIREKDNYVVNSINVKNIDETILQIKKNGGKILQDKAAIPGVGYYAIFEDTEKNILSIMENDAKAE